MIGYEKKELQKIIIDKKQVIEKKVVMNEVPGKSIVVVAKKTTSENDKQTAER